MRTISADREALHETYAEWLREATERLIDLTRMGIIARSIEVDVEELARWCKRHKRPVNGEVRSQFVAEKLRAEEQRPTTM